MKLIFLGTGAGRPTKTRNVTSIALILAEPHNGFWLFDIGEGTQQRLLETKLKLNKLERIFITHLHGDHLYGLPGLLSSRSFFDGASKLQLFGPPGLSAYIDCVFLHSGVHLNYELEIIEIVEGRVFADSRFTVEAAELNHRVRCFGYRIIERPQPGKLDLALLTRYGVKPGPMFGKLKNGEDITLLSGQVIRSSEVVGPPTKGRIVTILGDTSPCDNSAMLAHNADLLVHEATFAAGMEEKAADYGHSTIVQAAQIAVRADAKRLVVTHFSSRYDVTEIAMHVADVRTVFPNTEAAHDYYEIYVPK